MKVEVDILLFNQKMADLDIPCNDLPAKLSIDTTCIEAVRERGLEQLDAICDKTCMVYMKSGVSYQVNKSYKEMCALWQK